MQANPHPGDEFGVSVAELSGNVLIEGGAGETVRRNLLQQCDVHTLLRLPTAGTQSPLAPLLAPKFDKPNKSGATADKGPTDLPETAKEPTVDVSALGVKRNNPLTTAANGFSEWAALGSNQRLLPTEAIQSKPDM